MTETQACHLATLIMQEDQRVHAEAAQSASRPTYFVVRVQLNAPPYQRRATIRTMRVWSSLKQSWQELQS